MHICDSHCNYQNCSKYRRVIGTVDPSHNKTEPTDQQVMHFVSEDVGISAHSRGVFMGRWFHNRGEGTFRLETGGTGYVKDLTDWIRLMLDGKRV